MKAIKGKLQLTEAEFDAINDAQNILLHVLMFGGRTNVSKAVSEATTALHTILMNAEADPEDEDDICECMRQSLGNNWF